MSPNSFGVPQEKSVLSVDVEAGRRSTHFARAESVRFSASSQGNTGAETFGHRCAKPVARRKTTDPQKSRPRVRVNAARRFRLRRGLLTLLADPSEFLF